MHDATVVSEFTHQAEGFNRSAIAHAADTLDALLELAAPSLSERWLDAACGPGIVCRALALRAGSVHGVDLTAAMIDVARREAAAAGLTNTTYEVGDATALAAAGESYDGALARFAIHHMPLPSRLVGELARIVRPGGTVVLADHLATEDADAAAWTLEVERLRDPSHWASLPLRRLRELGTQAGLEPVAERVSEIELDFDDWLARGSGDAVLVEHALAQRPGGCDCFHVRSEGGRRVLGLRMWLSAWRR